MKILASLRLTPGAGTVVEAMNWLESTAEQEGWPTRLAFKLSLCLDEALTNIVTYGFKDRPADARTDGIVLDLSVGDGHIVIDIFDNGTPFDPTQKPSAPLAQSLEDTEIGGHGLRLMRHYLQDIEYRRVDQRNHLRLTAAFSA